MKKVIKFPYIFVVGNEKGGAGKTTCSMHLIVSLLEKGCRVGSVDTDSRQHSLTTYIQNRKTYNEKHPDKPVLVPIHHLILESTKGVISEKEEEEQLQFEEVINKLKSEVDIIVIDTPGRHSFLSCLAHSYADTVVTPINDSFLDVDVLAKIDAETLTVVSPSIYSQMIWEQKMRKSQRDNSSIEWIVLRNRLSNLDAVNKRNVNHVLEQLSQRIRFKNSPGFSERVIFRELFLEGLTLLDLPKTKNYKEFSMSHIAARQELRDFMTCLSINRVIESLEAR